MTDPQLRKACWLSYHLGGVLAAMVLIALGLPDDTKPGCELSLTRNACETNIGETAP